MTTPIIGGPRPLPAHRRAHSCYTFNCEEPVKRVKRLLSVLRNNEVLTSDAHVKLELHGEDEDTFQLEGTPRVLARNGGLLVDLYTLGYHVTFTDENQTRWPEANEMLSLRPRRDDTDSYLAHLDERTDRKRLITTLRSGSWHHNWALSIKYGRSIHAGHEDNSGLRFSSTTSSKSHLALYPGQWKKKSPKKSFFKKPASRFLKEWDASAD